MNLIDKFKQGDQVSFEVLFDQLYQRLCAYCARYIHDPSDAEDLVQDAFVALWHQRNQFEHINAIKSFLYTTVRNKCLNSLKHQSVIREHESRLIYELEHATLEHHIIEEEYYGRLHAEIRKLPESSQKIMVLVLQGMKNREIAKELNISENTIKTQKKIAYAKLRANLSPSIFSFLLSF